jgi:hypothetical protein
LVEAGKKLDITDFAFDQLDSLISGGCFGDIKIM